MGQIGELQRHGALLIMKADSVKARIVPFGFAKGGLSASMLAQRSSAAAPGASVSSTSNRVHPSVKRSPNHLAAFACQAALMVSVGTGSEVIGGVLGSM